MSSEPVQARLVALSRRYVTRCTTELFLAHGISVDAVPSTEDTIAPQSLAGVVGFVGDVCGTLLLSMPPEIIVAFDALRGSSVPLFNRRAQLDSVGALANELLVRIQLRFSEHGIKIRVNDPISLECDRLRYVGTRGETCRAEFRGSSALIQAWLDADIRNAFLWSDALFEESDLEPQAEDAVALQ